MPNGNSIPLFQRRHFDFIADFIAGLGSVTEFQRQGIALEVAEKLRDTNPRFDRERFIATATIPARPTPEGTFNPLDITEVPALAPPGPEVPRCAISNCGDYAVSIHRDSFYCARHSGDESCCHPFRWNGAEWVRASD